MTGRTPRDRRGRHLIVGTVLLVAMLGFLDFGAPSAAAAPSTSVAAPTSAVRQDPGAGGSGTGGTGGEPARVDVLRAPTQGLDGATGSETSDGDRMVTGGQVISGVRPDASGTAGTGSDTGDSMEALGAPVGLGGYPHRSPIGAASWLIFAAAALLAAGGVIALARASTVKDR